MSESDGIKLPLQCYVPYCGSTESKYWGTGPDGPKTLCYRCYQQYTTGKLKVFKHASGKVSVEYGPKSIRLKVVGFEKFIGVARKPFSRLYRDISKPMFQVAESVVGNEDSRIFRVISKPKFLVAESEAENEESQRGNGSRETEHGTNPVLVCKVMNCRGVLRGDVQYGPDGQEAICEKCFRKMERGELTLYRLPSGRHSVAMSRHAVPVRTVEVVRMRKNKKRKVNEAMVLDSGEKKLPVTRAKPMQATKSTRAKATKTVDNKCKIEHKTAETALRQRRVTRSSTKIARELEKTDSRDISALTLQTVAQRKIGAKGKILKKKAIRRGCLVPSCVSKGQERRTGPDGSGTLCLRCYGRYINHLLPVFKCPKTGKLSVTAGGVRCRITGFPVSNNRRDLLRPFFEPLEEGQGNKEGSDGAGQKIEGHDQMDEEQIKGRREGNAEAEGDDVEVDDANRGEERKDVEWTPGIFDTEPIEWDKTAIVFAAEGESGPGLESSEDNGTDIGGVGNAEYTVLEFKMAEETGTNSGYDGSTRHYDMRSESDGESEKKGQLDNWGFELTPPGEVRKPEDASLKSDNSRRLVSADEARGNKTETDAQTRVLDQGRDDVGGKVEAGNPREDRPLVYAITRPVHR